MDHRIVGLYIEPEGIDPCLLVEVEVPRGEAVAVGLQQYPEPFGSGLYQGGGSGVEIGLAHEVSPGEGHDVASRPHPLGGEDHLFGRYLPGADGGASAGGAELDPPRGSRSQQGLHAGATAAAEVKGWKAVARSLGSKTVTSRA